MKWGLAVTWLGAIAFVTTALNSEQTIRAVGGSYTFQPVLTILSVS